MVWSIHQGKHKRVFCFLTKVSMSEIPVSWVVSLISFSQLCPVSDNWQENKDQAFVDLHEYYTFIIIPLVMSPGFAVRGASQVPSLSSGASPVVLCNSAGLELICCVTQLLWGCPALQQFRSSSVEFRPRAAAHLNHHLPTGSSKIPLDLHHTGVCISRLFCGPG